MSRVLARVVTGVHDTLRGPDVIHRIAIRREWLLTGETVDLVLPRNLACARCEGGGCDACGRSGAISLRTRKEDPMTVQVTLPRRSSEELSEQPALVVRVPEHGGLGASPNMPRGLLLLRITPSANSDAGIALLTLPQASAADSPPSAQRASSVRPTQPRASAAFVVAALAWIGLVFALATGVVPADFLTLP